jgi:hypothetical protein
MTRPDRPPGLDAAGGPLIQPSRPRYQCHASPPRSQQESATAASVSPGADSGPDPWDGDLTVIRDSAESIPVWVGIWQARAEPDAHARRCASDAIDAIDQALAALHRTRARLITETGQADKLAAARADQLLARLREEEAR